MASGSLEGNHPAWLLLPLVSPACTSEMVIPQQNGSPSWHTLLGACRAITPLIDVYLT